MGGKPIVPTLPCGVSSAISPAQRITSSANIKSAEGIVRVSAYGLPCIRSHGALDASEGAQHARDILASVRGKFGPRPGAAPLYWGRSGLDGHLDRHTHR